MIDLSELLNTLQGFDCLDLVSRDIQLLLLQVLLYSCTNIYNILTRNTLIWFKFISIVWYSVLIKILEFEDKSMLLIEDTNLYDILIDY